MKNKPSIVSYETLEGIKYSLIQNDVISAEIMKLGFFEKYVTEASDKILSKCQQGIVLDIGANVGTFSIPLAKKFPHIHFCAFEPLPFVYTQLQTNISINNLDNVRAFNIALSYENKFDICNVFDNDCGNIGSNSLDKNINVARTNAIKLVNELVEFQTLDNKCFRNVRLIKIDVEGFEHNVITGGLQTIKECNYPPILFESWGTADWYKTEHNRLISFIRGIGYNIILNLNGNSDNYIAFKNHDECVEFGFLNR